MRSYVYCVREREENEKKKRNNILSTMLTSYSFKRKILSALTSLRVDVIKKRNPANNVDDDDDVRISLSKQTKTMAKRLVNWTGLRPGRARPDHQRHQQASTSIPAYRFRRRDAILPETREDNSTQNCVTRLTGCF